MSDLPDLEDGLTEDVILELKQQYIAEVLRRASGKWAHFFEDEAEELSQAMHNAPFHVACPVHGGENGFRLFADYNKTGGGICNTCKGKGNGISLFAWLREISQDEAAVRVDAWLQGKTPEALAKRAPPPPPKPKVDPVVAKRRLMEVLKGTQPKFEGSLGERYLGLRGIPLKYMPTTLRTHPGLDYYHGKPKTYYGKYPTLIAPIRDADHKLVSLHRIYLDPKTGAKADVPEVKKMMSACAELRGAAIKLFEPGEVLGVAEGIETALAAHVVSQMPVWSCITATLLEQVVIPDTVKHVVIWADLDRSYRGIEAAEALANRLQKEGKTVEICLPPLPIPASAKGLDWLDMLNDYGLSAFPAHWRRWRPSKESA